MADSTEGPLDDLVEERFQNPERAVFWLDPPGLLRQARRFADLSQRQLAARVGVSHSVVALIEAGRRIPRLDLYLRMLAATRITLVPQYPDGAEVVPMAPYAMRDAAGRHFPAHLDVRDVRGKYKDGGVWWYMGYDYAKYPVPLASFARDRERRDMRRRRLDLTTFHIDDRLELYRKHRGARSRQRGSADDAAGDYIDWW